MEKYKVGLHERRKRKGGFVMKLHTWEFPWVKLVEINLGDDGNRKRNRVCFFLEVLNH